MCPHRIANPFRASGFRHAGYYAGPCPRKGDKPHSYQFTLFAVNMDKLQVDENTSGVVVCFSSHFHTLSKVTFTATYGR